MNVDDDDEDIFFDKRYGYKLAYVISEQRRQERSVINWIYIGLDVSKPSEAKIGLTTGKLGTRASSSQNPNYALLCAFKIREGVPSQTVWDIEANIKALLSEEYENIPHYSSNQPSEWFRVSPHELRDRVHDLLYEHHSNHMYCYRCSERDIGVIRSWENRALLHNESRNPYQADDLSDRPVSWECFMPGGCGLDCNCFDYKAKEF